MTFLFDHYVYAISSHNLLKNIIFKNKNKQYL